MKFAPTEPTPKVWPTNVALFIITIFLLFTPVPLVEANSIVTGSLLFVIGLMMVVINLSFVDTSESFPWVICGLLFMWNGASWIFTQKAVGIYIINFL